MSDSDDENNIFFGTALQEEVESRAGQHSKTLQDPSLTKSLPVWKQVHPASYICLTWASYAAQMQTGCFLLCINRWHMVQYFPYPVEYCHLQEVTDAEGRRRFHGAFTGGYSAGFYNTVGSLEGWQPKTFTSSRDKRAGDRCHSSAHLPAYA